VDILWITFSLLGTFQQQRRACVSIHNLSTKFSDTFPHFYTLARLLLCTYPPILLVLLINIMKVTILAENIIPFTQLLGRVLPSHSQVPILTNVLLEATKDGLLIRATDLEMGVEVKIPAKIEEEGSITLPGKEFVETIGSLPKDKLSISCEKDIATLLCRDIKISFNTISADEFPKIYKNKGEVIAEFKWQEFVGIFSYLTFSVSYEISRPQLTGVYIDNKEDGINFVTTDGYRMSVKLTDQKGVIGGHIIAVSLINEALSLKGVENIVFYVNREESQIGLEAGSVFLVGRMIEGGFPDYGKVLPEDAKTTVRIEKEELLRAVKLVSIFAKDNSNVVNIEVRESSMRLNTRSQGVGGGEAVVDCVVDGGGGKTAFNIKYLMDFLKTIDDATIVMKLNSPTDPALFEVEEKHFRHVIMPVQVD